MCNDKKAVAEPDFNDPFGPPDEVVRVRCLHCNEEYDSNEITWNGQSELWVCKNYEKCGGAGYGMDIFDAENFNLDRLRGNANG